MSSRNKGRRNKNPYVHTSEVEVLKMGETTRLCPAGNVPEGRKNIGETGETEDRGVGSLST